jgi:hypothetical protein
VRSACPGSLPQVFLSPELVRLEKPGPRAPLRRPRARRFLLPHITLFDMDNPMPGFAAYQLIQVDTGVALYRTCATADEILHANDNLRRSGFAYRFYPAGTFTMPTLHPA